MFHVWLPHCNKAKLWRLDSDFIGLYQIPAVWDIYCSWKVSLGTKSPSITEITTPTKGKLLETSNKNLCIGCCKLHPVSSSFSSLISLTSRSKKSTDSKLLQHATPLCRSWVDYDIHGSRYHWHHWWRKHRPCSCHCPPTSSLQTKVWKKRKGAWKWILFQQSLELLTRGHLGMIPHIPRTRQIDPSFVWKGLLLQVPSVYVRKYQLQLIPKPFNLMESAGCMVSLAWSLKLLVQVAFDNWSVLEEWNARVQR